MATEAVPASATVASTGLGLRYIGSHCYSYSGNIANAGTGAADSLMLDFTSGAGYIIAELFWEVDSEGGIVYDIHVKLNGIKIIDSEFDAAPTHGLWSTPVKLIIPPFTHFEFLYGADAEVTSACHLVGRVYGVDE